MGSVPAAPHNDNRFLMSQSEAGGRGRVGGLDWRLIGHIWQSSACTWAGYSRRPRVSLLTLQAALSKLSAHFLTQKKTDSGAFIDAVAHTPTKDPLDARNAAARLTPSNYAPGE